MKNLEPELSCPNCEGVVILHDVASRVAKCRSCAHRFTAEEYVAYIGEVVDDDREDDADESEADNDE